MTSHYPTKLALTALLTLGIGACSDDSSSPTDVSLVGEYAMAHYNGWPVGSSFSLGSPGCSQQIDSGGLVLSADNTWQATMTFHNSCLSDTISPPPVTVAVSGSYQTAGASLRFTRTADSTVLPLVAADGQTVVADLRPTFGAITDFSRLP